AALALLAAVGCGGSSDGTDEPQAGISGPEGEAVDGGSLVFGIDYETSGWNPAIDQWAATGALVGSSVLEPLATLDGDGQAQPWLATSWDANDTNDVWTIHLREGVTFHDGTDFDAEAAAANLEFIRTAPLSSIAFGPMIDAVNVVDPATVEVRLTSAWGAFPSSFMASQGAFMRAPASLEAEDK
ncbi:MAG: hypothetical protein KDD83_29985, partial [Caldilineaceae bacterium]|nr:hypothetical protein [Caldilineaceae bacterium]